MTDKQQIKFATRELLESIRFLNTDDRYKKSVLARIPKGDVRLPVYLAINHNDSEMRCIFVLSVDEKANTAVKAKVDMSFEDYKLLPVCVVDLEDEG